MTKTTAWLLVVLLLALMVALTGCVTARPDPMKPWEVSPEELAGLGADLTWGILTKGKYSGVKLLK